ncbi:MAG: bifunctional nuclease family protein [Anaerolineales bacterium]|nr:bifunctional nuclease family protein [Anaerolineales bacterium]
MTEMIEVVIDSIRVGLMSQNRVIILRELNSERYLAIWIDAYMAEQITFALQEIEVARPMSHDLMKQILHTLNARLIRIEVTDLKNEVFYGNLVVELDNGHQIEIDSRPSDALALAVRHNVPILVAAHVMDEAGIIPEKDISTETDTPDLVERADQDPSPPAEDRLSIFEDFLDNLELPDEDENEDDSKD